MSISQVFQATRIESCQSLQQPHQQQEAVLQGLPGPVPRAKARRLHFPPWGVHPPPLQPLLLVWPLEQFSLGYFFPGCSGSGGSAVNHHWVATRPYHHHFCNYSRPYPVVFHHLFLHRWRKKTAHYVGNFLGNTQPRGSWLGILDLPRGYFAGEPHYGCPWTFGTRGDAKIWLLPPFLSSQSNC